MPYQDAPSLSTPYFQNEIFSKPIPGTDDLQVEETYLQNRADYAPQDIDTESSRNSDYYLVEEKYEPYGPPNSTVVEITRIYCQVPATRNETSSTQYTYPGLTGGTGANWDKYGFRAPITLQVNATDNFSYFRSTAKDGSEASLPDLTIPTLTVGMATTQVDYMGLVYATKAPFDLLGATDPASDPSTYTISAAVSRWKGNIWQLVVRTVPEPGVI